MPLSDRMAVSSADGTQLPTAEGDELTWWRFRGDGSGVIKERISDQVMRYQLFKVKIKVTKE